MSMHLDADKWQFYRSVIDGEELSISGINIWQYKWNNLRQYISIKDPIYGQDYVMTVYEVTNGKTTVRFAAGEFSNLVWGIYLPVTA